MNTDELTLSKILRPHIVPRRSDAICRRWRNGEQEPDTLAVLREQPELLTEETFVFDLIFEEYCLRLERGENVDVDAFCARFPYPSEDVKNMLLSCWYLHESGLLDRAKVIDWPEPGNRIGDLNILRELGRGQFARVYLAREESTGGRLVAVKFTWDSAHEALTLGPLNHRNIVKVLSAGPDEQTGLNVVRMPYHGPATLKDLIDRAAVPPHSPRTTAAAIILDAARSEEPVEENEEPHRVLLTGTYEDGVVWLIGKIAGALAFLHQRGICHRDLKPTNVLLSPSGQPLLLDFNVAIDAGAISDGNATRQGGTFPYMPAEVLHQFLDRNFKEQRPEADVFALGVIGHQLLTGEHPFGPIPSRSNERDLIELLLQRQESDSAPSIAATSPFSRLLVATLAQDPALRPTAAQLQAAAEVHLASRSRQHRLSLNWVSLLAAGLLLALTAGGFAWLRSASHAAPAPAPRTEKDQAKSLYLNGKRYLADGNRPFALDSFLRSYGLDPQARTQASIAYVLALKKEHEDAIKQCDLAIKEGFSNAQLYNNRGFSIMQRWGRKRANGEPVPDAEVYREARADFLEAIARDPKCPTPYTHLSLLVIHLWEHQRLSNPTWTPAEEDIEIIRRGMKLEGVGCRQATYAARVLALTVGNRPERNAEVLSYLTLALEKGFDPHSLQNERDIYRPIENLPEFQRLCKAPRTNPPVIREESLLDPDPTDAR
jgi:serine/threonine protein kinase